MRDFDLCSPTHALSDARDGAVVARGALAGAAPAEAVGLLPSRPILSSAGRGWDGVALQRYLFSPGVVDLPRSHNHRLVLHLAGPTLVEGECDGRRERRWSDSGHAGLTPAGLPVTLSIKGRPDILYIYIAPALVDEVAAAAYGLDPARVSLVQRLAVPDEGLDRLGRLLLAEAEADSPGGRLAADAVARMLAVHLLRRHSSLAPRSPAPPDGAMAGRRLRRVIEHMRAHLAEDLPLVQLAAVGGLGPSQFARAFREATGEPPHRHLVRLRVERARELLERTALPVIEVGLRCGFGQPSHFATAFRKSTGMSPRAWRAAR